MTDSAPHRPVARSRGRLVLDRGVIEKIAGQAASEVAAAGASSGGFLGIGSRTDLSARPGVDAVLEGSNATLALDLTVAYPTPIRQTASRVRDHVGRRVEFLAGVQVTRVDITVTATHRVHGSDHRVRTGPQEDPR